jgi:hypothetical protein
LAAGALLAAALLAVAGSRGAGHARADIIQPSAPTACSSDPADPCISIPTLPSQAAPILVTGVVGQVGVAEATPAPQLELDIRDGDTIVFSSQSAQIVAQPSIQRGATRAIAFNFSVDQSAIPGSSRYLNFSVTATSLSNSTDTRGVLLPFHTHHTSNVYRVFWINPTPHLSVLCKWSTSFFSPEPTDDGWLVSATNLPASTVAYISLIDDSTRRDVWDFSTTTDDRGRFDIESGDWHNAHIPADAFSSRDTDRYHVEAAVPSAGLTYQTSPTSYFAVCSSPH